jgi:hypothetical protein
MRVEDSQQVEAAFFDPFEGAQLFERIHPKARRTPFCIFHREQTLHPASAPGEQSARFERSLPRGMANHPVEMLLCENEAGEH